MNTPDSKGDAVFLSSLIKQLLSRNDTVIKHTTVPVKETAAGLAGSLQGAELEGMGERIGE